MASSSNPHSPDPHEIVHTIRNQLGLISGHASLLKMNPEHRLTDNDLDSLEKISAAVFEISSQMRLLSAYLEPKD